MTETLKSNLGYVLVVNLDTCVVNKYRLLIEIFY